uniref:Uncharacterized protein n=1 Tax=Enterobacter asburiae TaxID=61645 RepID=A0A455VYH9_ENTAS|nr:hypothetical protein MRY18106EAS_33220 [Enterobacter asburiae]
MIRTVENPFCLAHIWRQVKSGLRPVLVFTLRAERCKTANGQNGQIFIQFGPGSPDISTGGQLLNESALVDVVTHAQHAFNE